MHVIVTGKSQLSSRSFGSVAVQLTWVVPIGKSDPGAGEQVTSTGVQLSVAKAANDLNIGSGGDAEAGALIREALRNMGKA